MQVIIVDQLAVNYDRKGKGKTVLLLHGWGDSQATFSSLVSELATRFDTISLDLPGFGDSEAPKAAWDLDNYAQFIADFLKKLRVETYALIGHSNGGALAVRGLAKETLKAERLVLLASAGVRNTQKGKRLVTKIIAKLGKLLTFWLPVEQKQKLRQKLYGTIGSDLLVAPHLEETFKLTVRQDVQADARQLSLPTLLIFAANDPAIPLSDGKRFNALIKNSRLEVLAGSDHFIHHDQPQKIAKLIMEFL